MKKQFSKLIILIKINKWLKRYLKEPLTNKEYIQLRKQVLTTSSSKKDVIDLLDEINHKNLKKTKKIWDSYLEKTLPSKHKNISLKIQKKAELTAVIVEARKHPHFKVVVENVILNTQHLNVCLRVYHGTENEKFVKDCLKEYNNVQFINLNVENLDIEAYNKIMLSEDFYKNIESEHILVFQTDVITFKPLDKTFLKFDYIGAPWKKELHKEYRAEVGNGGLSIRSKKAMIHILQQKITREPFAPEDLYLAQILKEQNFNVAPYKIAKEFATEDVYNPNAFGCHKSWELISTKELKNLLKLKTSHA